MRTTRASSLAALFAAACASSVAHAADPLSFLGVAMGDRLEEAAAKAGASCRKQTEKLTGCRAEPAALPLALQQFAGVPVKEIYVGGADGRVGAVILSFDGAGFESLRAALQAEYPDLKCEPGGSLFLQYCRSPSAGDTQVTVTAARGDPVARVSLSSAAFRDAARAERAATGAPAPAPPPPARPMPKLLVKVTDQAEIAFGGSGAELDARAVDQVSVLAGKLKSWRSLEVVTVVGRPAGADAAALQLARSRAEAGAAALASAGIARSRIYVNVGPNHGTDGSTGRVDIEAVGTQER